MSGIEWIISQGGWVSYTLAFVSVLLWTAMFIRGLALWPTKNLNLENQDGRGTAITDFLSEVHQVRSSSRRLAQLAERSKRRLNIMRDFISTLIVIAPLLGLLGTVIGMVEMFGSLQSAHGTGGEETVAGGISTALVTTQLGLVIAAPGLLVAYWLTRQQVRRERDIEHVVRALEETTS